MGTATQGAKGRTHTVMTWMRRGHFLRPTHTSTGDVWSVNGIKVPGWAAQTVFASGRVVGCDDDRLFPDEKSQTYRYAQPE